MNFHISLLRHGPRSCSRLALASGTRSQQPTRPRPLGNAFRPVTTISTPLQSKHARKASSTIEPPAVKFEDSEPGTDYAISLILMGERLNVRMLFTIVDEDDPEKKSQTLDLTHVKTAPYERNDPTQAGTQLETQINVPAGFKPGVIVLNKLSEPDSKDESPICVATIELKAVDSNAQPIIYSAYTYIDIDQSDRYIFPATTPLPAFEGTTPAGLLHYRRKELEILRGTKADMNTMRKGSERIYQFDVYNDLGNPTAKPAKIRPVLGGGDFKYPRRMRTGRPMDGVNELPAGTDVPWLPLDERFNTVKYRAFTGDTTNSKGRSLRALLGTPGGLSFAANLIPFINQMVKNSPHERFSSLSVVDSMYEGLAGSDKEEAKLIRQLQPIGRLQGNDLLATLKQRWKSMDAGVRKLLGMAAPAIPAHDIDDIMSKPLTPEQRKKTEVSQRYL